MDDMHGHSLAQLEPEGLAAEGPGWQQRKSALTRTTILEAASRSGPSIASDAAPTATATEPARQRSPALPNAEFRIAGTASGSRSSAAWR